MWRIGITGGIGAGKSFVSEKLRTIFGIPVYDSDSQAKQIITTDANVKEKLIQLVGGDLFIGNELQRHILAQYLFASENHANNVNAIVHPAVRLDFRQWTERQYTPIVALESAILFESGFDNEVDETWVVDAPLEVRLQRAMQRDKTSEEMISKRIKLQQTASSLQLADYVITNDGQTDITIQLQHLLRNERN